jgi:hypothetical protein
LFYGADKMIPVSMLERIESLKPWFHTIDLGNGMRIERDPVHGGNKDYPQGLWRELQSLLPVKIEGLVSWTLDATVDFFPSK